MALGQLVLAGGTRHCVLVAADAATPITPCGGCRQKLREFAARRRGAGGSADLSLVLHATRWPELLPQSFGPDHLGPR